MTHDLLVDRLRFLPNNTVEGEQVILVRAISGDQASTNLAIGILIIGEEKTTQSDSESSFMGIVVGILTLLVLVLLSALIFAGIQLRDRGFFEKEDDYFEDGELVEEILSEAETSQSESIWSATSDED